MFTESCSTNSDFYTITCLHGELNHYHRLLSHHISLVEKEDNVWDKWPSFQIHEILKPSNDHHGLSRCKILHAVLQSSHKIQLWGRRHKMEVEGKHNLRRESWVDLVMFGTFCRREDRSGSRLKRFQED